MVNQDHIRLMHLIMARPALAPTQQQLAAAAAVDAANRLEAELAAIPATGDIYKALTYSDWGGSQALYSLLSDGRLRLLQFSAGPETSGLAGYWEISRFSGLTLAQAEAKIKELNEWPGSPRTYSLRLVE